MQKFFKRNPQAGASSLQFPPCMNANDSLLHLFLLRPYSSVCWNSFFSIFDIARVFDASLSSSVHQLLKGLSLPKKHQLIRLNLLKALLLELWFQRNQQIFQDKKRSSSKIFNSVQFNVAAWCSLYKNFAPLSQLGSFSISVSFLRLLSMQCSLSGIPWSLFLCFPFIFSIVS